MGPMGGNMVEDGYGKVTRVWRGCGTQWHGIVVVRLCHILADRGLSVGESV